jgi:hypothetical protein
MIARGSLAKHRNDARKTSESDRYLRDHEKEGGDYRSGASLSLISPRSSWIARFSRAWCAKNG